MRAKLISRDHGDFEFREEATIGRSAESSIRIEVKVVSTEHARITYDAERSRYVLEDLGSLNGTKLDGVRIERPEPLASLHLICLGGSENFIFHDLSGGGEGGLDTIELPPVDKTRADGEVPPIPDTLLPEQVAAEESESDGTRVEKDVVPLPEVLAAASAAAAGDESAEQSSAGSSSIARRLGLVLDLEAGAQTFELPAGESIIGRSREADISIDVPDLSRRHAVLKVKDNRLSVRDLASRNHTFLNGDEVERETPVEIGARIVFGRLEGRVVGIEEPEEG